MVTDHLSCLPLPPNPIVPIDDHFLDEQLMSAHVEPWFANIVNFKVIENTPKD